MKKFLFAFLLLVFLLQTTIQYNIKSLRSSRQNSRPYRLEKRPYRLESRPYIVESRPYIVESRPYIVESRPHRLESRPHRLESRPYRLESRPYRLESRPYKLESEHHYSEIETYPNFDSLQYESESEQYRPDSESEQYRPDSESEQYRPETGLINFDSGVFYQQYGPIEGIDIISSYKPKALIKTYTDYYKNECFDKCLNFNCYIVIYTSYSCSIYNDTAQSYLFKSIHSGIGYVRRNLESTFCMKTDDVISPNLVEYWQFCASTKNFVTENDMTIVQLGNLTNDRNDNPYSAFSINNGFGQIPPGNYFNYDITTTGTGFTIMFWMKLSTLPALGATVLNFGVTDTSRSDSILIHFDESSILSFVPYDTAGNLVVFSTLTSFAINRWYHIALTVTNNGGLIANWYVDGKFESSLNKPGFTINHNIVRKFNYIGLNILRNTPGLDAVIDELKFFNIPLTSSEIIAEKSKLQSNKMIKFDYLNVYNRPSDYTSGLTFHWPLSNNFVEYINNKDLTDLSNDAFTFDRFDAPKSALFLSSSYLTAPTYNYFNNTGFTIMTWIKVLHPNGISSDTDLLTVLDFGDGCNYNNIKFQLMQSSNTQTYKLRFQTYTNGVNTAAAYISNGGINVGEWHHIAVSYLSATSVTLYIDGVAEAVNSGPFTLPPIFISSINFIGRSCNLADSNDLTAAINEIKIFNKGQISVLAEMNFKDPFFFYQVQSYQ